MNYTTGVPFGPAVSQPTRDAALKGLSAPFSFPGSGSDVYASKAAANMTAYDRAAQEADMDYMQQARDAQQQMALRGLEQVAQQQQNQMNIDTRRQGMAMDFVNGILGGLFR